MRFKQGDTAYILQGDWSMRACVVDSVSEEYHPSIGKWWRVEADGISWADSRGETFRPMDPDSLDRELMDTTTAMDAIRDQSWEAMEHALSHAGEDKYHAVAELLGVELPMLPPLPDR